jgi:hypothetical protein
MLSIAFAELSRFKKLAISMAVFQFLAILFLFNVNWLMEAFVSVYLGTMMVNIVFGAGLGWFQMHSLTKPNGWAFLIHRPLSRFTLFAGFGFGAFLVLVIGAVLPLLLGLAVIDLSFEQAIDWRLYLLVPSILGLMLCCYFAAAFAVLSASKLAPLVVVLITLLLTSKAHGLWVFVTLAVVLLWLAYITYCAFKPALGAHVKQPLAAALITLPIQYALSVILTSVFMVVYSFSLILIDPEHNGSWTDYWQSGSFHFVEQMSEQQQFEYALAQSGLKAKDIGITDSTPVSYSRFSKVWDKPIIRNQLFYMDEGYQVVGKLMDSSNGINWYFSHEEGLFFGIHVNNEQFQGWMDNAGKVHLTTESVAQSQRFSQLPRTTDDSVLYVGQHAWSFDNKGLHKVLSLSEGETFSSAHTTVGKHTFVMSDQYFYVFNEQGVSQKVPLNTQLNNLARVSTALVNDVLYVSVLSGVQQQTNYQEANHAFYSIDQNGDVTHLSTQSLTQDWSAIYRYRHFIISPAYKYLHDIVWSIIEPYRQPSLTLKRIVTQAIPTNVIWAMLLVSIVCMAVTALVTQPLSLSTRRKYSWIVINGLTGMPGLISFFFLNHRYKPPRNNSS